MNNRFLALAPLIACSTFFIAGCSDDNSSFETPNTSGNQTNTGLISQKNFSLLTADVAPAVINATTGVFTKTDVELTVFIGDRKNQTLTDAHTIFFMAEYGLVQPSCVTVDGTCSVIWSAIKRPDAGGPGSDGQVTITAYTVGEEGFTDTNGNNVFDDGDLAFDDIEEPYIDTDESDSFTIGDVIIDTVNAFDPTGRNEQHEIADGLFNGPGCSHTTLCAPAQSTTVFDGVTMSIVANVILSRTIGGSVAGLTGSGLVMQNNGGDNLPISANGGYTFATPVDDGQTYNVTVSTQPTTPAQICTVANNSGTVSANVTNADVTCVDDTFTIGGTVTGLAGTGLVLQNNAGDDLTITANGGYTFSTAINNGATYSVSVSTNPTGLSQTCSVTNGAGTATADVTNADVNCVTDTTFTIGGTVSITAGQTLVIRNNGGDDLSLTDADSNFVFATAIDDGSTYNVTQFSYTNGTCTFTDEASTVAGANVSNIDISCP